MFFPLFCAARGALYAFFHPRILAEQEVKQAREDTDKATPVISLVSGTDEGAALERTALPKQCGGRSTVIFFYFFLRLRLSHFLGLILNCWAWRGQFSRFNSPSGGYCFFSFNYFSATTAVALEQAGSFARQYRRTNKWIATKLLQKLSPKFYSLDHHLFFS